MTEQDEDALIDHVNAILAIEGLTPRVLRQGSVSLHFDAQGVYGGVSVHFTRNRRRAQGSTGAPPRRP